MFQWNQHSKTKHCNLQFFVFCNKQMYISVFWNEQICVSDIRPCNILQKKPSNICKYSGNSLDSKNIVSVSLLSCPSNSFSKSFTGSVILYKIAMNDCYDICSSSGAPRFKVFLLFALWYLLCKWSTSIYAVQRMAGITWLCSIATILSTITLLRFFGGGITSHSTN